MINNGMTFSQAAAASSFTIGYSFTPQWGMGRQQNINANMLSNGSAYADAVVAHGNYQREKEAYNYANSTYAWDSKGLKSYEPFATFSDWYNKTKEISSSLIKNAGNFEGVSVYESIFFNDGSAMTIPKIGIFVGQGYFKDTKLLQHEYSHILYAQKYGLGMYFGVVVPVSLYSASNLYTGRHMHTWAEMEANQLGFKRFMSSWDLEEYPIYIQKK